MADLNRKNRQYLIAGLLAAIILALFIGLNSLLDPGPRHSATSRVPSNFDESILSDRTSAASPEMSWITQSRREIDRLTHLVEEQIKTDAERERLHKKELEALRKDYDEALLQQVTKLEELRQDVETRPAPRATSTQTTGLNPETSLVTDTEPTTSVGTEFIRRNNERRPSTDLNPTGEPSTENTPEPKSFGASFELSSASSTAPSRKSLGNYLPAGSYAPAVVLSGADATTNVTSRENPLPVIFRITGPAVTAGTGKGRPARIDITGCTVQGSATGDLSAERVYVRLISMTCLSGRKGEILETEIAGYMAGSGKAGVRGKVVSREGNLVSNAAIAGTLAGIGSAASSTANAGSSSDTAASADLIRQAGAAIVGNGMTTAATTLSDYYVQRAEQYQPIVSLYGGTKVELVFLKGVDLKP